MPYTTKTAVRLRFLANALMLAGCLMAMPAFGATKAGDYYEDALRRYEQHDIKGAIIQLKNALQQDPKMLSAQVLLADAYLRTGSFSAAEAALDIAAGLGADPSVTAPRYARAYLGQFKFKTLLDRVRPKGLPPPVASEVLLFRGMAYMELGHLKQADQALREAERLNPDSARIKIAQGKLLLRQGDLRAARAVADRAVSLSPIDPDAWNLKASVAHLSGDVNSALAAYAKALSLDPSHMESRIGRASLLLDLKRQQEAQADIKSLEQYRTADPRAAYLVALDAARRGDKEETRKALTDATNILDQLPPEMIQGNSQLLMLGGLANYGLDKPQQARSYLDAYMRLHPDQPGVRKLLATIALNEKDYGRVIELLYPMAGGASPDPQLLSLLASAYMGKQRYQLATDLFEKAASLSNHSQDIAIDLGVSHLAGGQIAQGIAELERVFAEDPGQSRAGMVLAVTYLRQGQAARAVDVIRKILSRDPGNLTALNLLGTTLAARGDAKGARAEFTKAARLDRNFLPAQLNIARLDATEGRPEAARSRLQAILKASPNNPDAMLELARLAVAQGKADEAMRLLEKVRASSVKPMRPLLYLAELYLRKGDTDKAVGVAQDLDNAYPDKLPVLEILGRAYQAAGSRDKAWSTFHHMIRSAGSDSADLTRVAQLLIGVGAYQDAGFALDQALSNNPGYLPARLQKAVLDFKAGRLAEAEAKAVDLIKSNPKLVAAYRLLGAVRLARKNYAGAITAYRDALARQASNANNLALYRAYFAADDTRSALALMEDWLRRHPDDMASRAALAEGYLRTGQLQKARDGYEQVLKKYPKDVNSLNNLANILLKMGDPHALEYAQRAYTLAPKDALVSDTLGWILVQQGQPDSALPYLRDASLRVAENPEIHYHLAAALHRLGRNAEAKRELRKAMSKGGEFEGAAEARKLMDQL